MANGDIQPDYQDVLPPMLHAAIEGEGSWIGELLVGVACGAVEVYENHLRYPKGAIDKILSKAIRIPSDVSRTIQTTIRGKSSNG